MEHTQNAMYAEYDRLYPPRNLMQALTRRYNRAKIWLRAKRTNGLYRGRSLAENLAEAFNVRLRPQRTVAALRDEIAEGVMRLSGERERCFAAADAALSSIEAAFGDTAESRDRITAIKWQCLGSILNEGASNPVTGQWNRAE